MEEAKSEELANFPEERDQKMQGMFDTVVPIFTRDSCIVYFVVLFFFEINFI